MRRFLSAMLNTCPAMTTWMSTLPFGWCWRQHHATKSLDAGGRHIMQWMRVGCISAVVVVVLLLAVDGTGECLPFCLSSPPYRAAFSIVANLACTLTLVTSTVYLLSISPALQQLRRSGSGLARSPSLNNGFGASPASNSSPAFGQISYGDKVWASARRTLRAFQRSGFTWSDTLAVVALPASLTLLLWSASSIVRHDVLYLWPIAWPVQSRLNFRPFNAIDAMSTGGLAAMPVRLPGFSSSSASAAAAAAVPDDARASGPSPHVIVLQYDSRSSSNERVQAALDNTRAYAERHGYGFVDGAAWYGAAGIDGGAWRDWSLQGPLAGLGVDQGYDLTKHKAPNWSKIKLLAAVMDAVRITQQSGDSSGPGRPNERQMAMLGKGYAAAIASSAPVWLLWTDSDAVIINHHIKAHEMLSAVLDDDALDRYAAVQAARGYLPGSAVPPLQGEASGRRRQTAIAPTSGDGDRGAGGSGSSADTVDLVMTLSMFRSPVVHRASDSFNAGMFFLRCSDTAGQLLGDMWRDWRFDQLVAPWASSPTSADGAKHGFDQLEQGAMQQRVASGGVSGHVLMQATAHPLLRHRSDVTLGCMDGVNEAAAVTLEALLAVAEAIDGSIALPATSTSGINSSDRHGAASEASEPPPPELELVFTNGSGLPGEYPPGTPPWVSTTAAADSTPSSMPSVTCVPLPLSRVRVFSQASINTFPSSWDWHSDRTRDGDWIAHPAGDAWKDDRVAAYVRAAGLLYGHGSAAVVDGTDNGDGGEGAVVKAARLRAVRGNGGPAAGGDDMYTGSSGASGSIHSHMPTWNYWY